MHAANTLSILALVGSSLAAPHYGQGRPVNNNVEVVYETVVHTAYVTEVYGQAHHYTPRPKPKTTTKVVQVKPTSTPAPAPVYSAPSYEAPAPAPTSTKVTTPAPAPTGEPSTGYMAIVDEWRAKLGLSQLEHDSTLEANAEKTAREGNGQMKHQLNPGSMAQVLAPGEEDEFLHVFVGGWLCEIPSLPGLDGVCTEQSKGWKYDSTGHADILTSPSYSKIGCSCVTKIWSCDLA